MRQRRHAKKAKDPAYHEINRLMKRSVREDCQDIRNRISKAKSSSLYQEIKYIIAPKRGSAKAPEKLTPDELNEYFTKVGNNTRDEVIAKFDSSSRNRLATRLPRVNAGSMRLTPLTLIGA